MATVPTQDLETLAAQLASARQALHDLSIGKTVQEIVADGYVTKFVKPNRRELLAYISWLEGQIRNYGTGRRQGAIGFTF